LRWLQHSHASKNEKPTNIERKHAREKNNLSKIGDDAVRAKTDRVWKDWFKILDKFDMKEKGHTQAAKYLRHKHALSEWWAQGGDDSVRVGERLALQRVSAMRPMRRDAGMVDCSLHWARWVVGGSARQRQGHSDFSLSGCT